MHSSSTGKEDDSTEVNYMGVTNHVETRQHNLLWSLTNLTTRCSVYEATLIAAHRTECFDILRVISSRKGISTGPWRARLGSREILM